MPKVTRRPAAPRPRRGRRRRGRRRRRRSRGRTASPASARRDRSSARRERGDARGGRGVAADRLEHDRLRRDAGQAQLLGDDEAVLVIGDDERRREALAVGDAQRRLLQQAALADTAAGAASGRARATSATAACPSRPTGSPGGSAAPVHWLAPSRLSPQRPRARSDHQYRDQFKGYLKGAPPPNPPGRAGLVGGRAYPAPSGHWAAACATGSRK